MRGNSDDKFIIHRQEKDRKKDLYLLQRNEQENLQRREDYEAKSFIPSFYKELPAIEEGKMI